MDEVVVIWESHKVAKPEFRLYYDDRGCAIAYTCEKLEGNYIIIDATTFVVSLNKRPVTLANFLGIVKIKPRQYRQDRS